jgi:hypothetical protein
MNIDKVGHIFVFGSNLTGRHGKGAALTAKESYGAKWNIGVGPQGKSYAIPTKDSNLQPLTLTHIRLYVDQFLEYASLVEKLRQRTEEDDVLHAYGYIFLFKVTRIGCGYAGYKDKDIAPLFKHAPENCYFDKRWSEFYPHKPEKYYFEHTDE